MSNKRLSIFIILLFFIIPEIAKADISGETFRNIVYGFITMLILPTVIAIIVLIKFRQDLQNALFYNAIIFMINIFIAILISGSGLVFSFGVLATPITIVFFITVVLYFFNKSHKSNLK